MKEGALIIYHKEGTNQILLGEEASYLWNMKVLPQDVLDAERVITKPIDLNNYDKREDLTKIVVGQVDAQIKKENPRGINFDWLVPPVKESSKQNAAPAGSIVYSTHTRKKIHPSRFSATPSYGPPKGGKEGNETPLETITREIQEEIGNLPPELMPTINDKYAENAANGYAIFYKRITSDQSRIIQKEIWRRKDIHIGEMFNLSFYDKKNANEDTKKVLEKINHLLNDKKGAIAAAAALKAAAEEAAKNAASGAAGSTKGGRRHTKKQRKHKKTKKHTRRR